LCTITGWFTQFWLGKCGPTRPIPEVGHTYLPEMATFPEESILKFSQKPFPWYWFLGGISFQKTNQNFP
jgi:hypothetical protein